MDKATFVSGLLSGLVGAVVGGVITLIVAYETLSHETQEKMREIRRTSYQTLVSATFSVRRAGDTALHLQSVEKASNPDAGISLPAVQALEASSRQLEDSFAGLRLFASSNTLNDAKQIQEQAKQLYANVVKAAETVTVNNANKPEADAAREAARNARDDMVARMDGFFADARRDLGAS